MGRSGCKRSNSGYAVGFPPRVQGLAILAIVFVSMTCSGQPLVQPDPRRMAGLCIKPLTCRRRSDMRVPLVIIGYIERLADARIEHSVGRKGNIDDNAMAGMINGPYKPELIQGRGTRATREVTWRIVT